MWYIWEVLREASFSSQKMDNVMQNEWVKIILITLIHIHHLSSYIMYVHFYINALEAEVSSKCMYIYGVQFAYLTRRGVC